MVISNISRTGTLSPLFFYISQTGVMDRQARRIKRYLRFSCVEKRTSVDVSQIIPLQKNSVKENNAQKEFLEVLHKFTEQY